MKATHRLIAVLGLGFALAPFASFGQATGLSPAEATTPVQTAPAIAPEDQATKEQLEKLFDVMHARRQIQSMLKIIPTMMEKQVRQQFDETTAQISSGKKLTDEQRAAIDRVLHQYLSEAMNLYSTDEMLDDMTGLYRKYLTREDVDAMIAFYSSSAGQHLLEAQPKIVQEYMPLVMQRAQERMKTLTAKMMKDLAVLNESSGQAQPEKK